MTEKKQISLTTFPKERVTTASIPMFEGGSCATQIYQPNREEYMKWLKDFEDLLRQKLANTKTSICWSCPIDCDDVDCEAYKFLKKLLGLEEKK